MTDIENLLATAGKTVGYKPRAQASLFSGQGANLPVGACVGRTVSNMLAHATNYDHWIFAYSGGKDSSTVVTLIVTLLEMGLLPRPRSIAVIAADTLIRETCDFTRREAFELSRLCSTPSERGISSMAMRMWRQFAYPLIASAWKAPWVISYQDAARHTGNIYRYDGWLIVGYSVSGTDPRADPGTAKVKRKVIWGWNADAAAMRAKEAPERPAWAA